MARDLYSRPPRPAASAMTRRALLGLRTPVTSAHLDGERAAEARRAVRAGWAQVRAMRMLRAIDPVAETLREIAGAHTSTRLREVGFDEDPVRLPDGDGTFDVVLSSFAAALDPEPERTVAELTRITAPGGTVGLTAWLPRGLPGRLPEFVERIRLRPAGLAAPGEWGREPVARARLEKPLEAVEVRTRTVRLRFADADEAFSVLTAPAPLDGDQLDRLRPDFDRLLASCDDGLGDVEIAGRYLLALGRKPATP